jgi:hypothetical protein
VKKDTYFAQNEDCLRNGSFYRFTGRKKYNRFAFYILGDFHGFVDELPENIELQTWEAKDGGALLPACF